MAQQYADRVEAMSGGRLKIELLPAGAVVKAFLNVLLKIFCGLGRVFEVEFDLDVTKICFKDNHLRRSRL